jgi:REP element-mobilizing transposase RayT
MPRKHRLEFPGAIYHVISRGNYRQDIFAEVTTKAAFEKCLFEACAKSGWVLHAYVIMSNHFHLALETPAGNLVVGMRWLLSTFSARFNRFRAERGHVFQGRYKSLLVEGGTALGQVCHYIHLNPVRAGITSLAGLRDWRYSSYWLLWRPRTRPAFVHLNSCLEQAGALADTPVGRAGYADYLAWQVAAGPAGTSAAYQSMSRGWALGGEGYKRALLRDHQILAESKAWENTGAKEVRELHWQAALERMLQKLKLDPERSRSDRKSADWKIAVAAQLKATTNVSNGWLAEALRMGKPGSVSIYVSQVRRGKARAAVQRQIQILED